MSVDLSTPRSHIDTPAWQSFELRMRVRAAERRAARRKRRIQYGALAIFTVVVTAGSFVAVRELERRPELLTLSWQKLQVAWADVEGAWRTVTWPDVPAPPALALPVTVAALPVPSNWESVIDPAPALPEAPKPESEPVAEPAPTPARPRAAAPQPVTQATSTTAPAPARTIVWPPPPRPRETPPAPIEPVRLADPPPPAVSPVPMPAAPTAAAVTTPRVDPRDTVRRAIERYRSAYERLDASAARAVWPGVDAGALSRAFGALASQELQFDGCSIAVSGASADANCTGRSRVVPKIGGGSESARRTWQFKLRQAGSDWVIQSATVR